MSTWIVQFLIVALFALTCGVLAVAWMRGRLGIAALVLFVVSVARLDRCVRRDHERVPRREQLRDVRRRLRRRSTTCRRSRSSRRRSSSRSPLSRCCRARPALARAACARARESRVVASSFKLPDLGEGLTEGEVARWLVAEGQEIAEDDPLVEIQTDKATVEIPSPYGGTVLQVLVAEGDVVPVGTELVVIGAPGETPPTPSPLGERRHSASRHTGPGPRAGDARSSAGSRRSSASTWRRCRGERAGRPDHRGRRARRRRRGGRRAARAAARRPPRDRRAHGARAPRGAARDLGRGVRLRGRSARPPPARPS